MLKFIADKAHYSEVIARVPKVKRSLWIGTADIKDLYVKVGSQTKPFLAVLAQLIKKGVEVRLIHAKEPGPAFREDFDKHPALFDGLERALCPRVHFKILVFDVGSANPEAALDLGDSSEYFGVMGRIADVLQHNYNYLSQFFTRETTNSW